MNQINPKIIRQLVVLLLIILLGGLIFFTMLPYISGVLGAVTLYVLLRNPMSKLVEKGWKPGLASVFLLLLTFIGILLPIAGVTVMLGNKAGQAVKRSERVVSTIKEQLAILEGRIGFDITSGIDASAVSKGLSESLKSIAGSTFTIAIALGIMYFMLYYMLTKRQVLRNTIYEYLPVSRVNLTIIGADVRAMVRSNALGIPLVALAQGFVALIGFFIFGIENPFFWAVIVTIGSMVPFIGGLLGIIPVFFLAYGSGQSFQAWGILLYGIIIVGSTDNLIRLFLLRKLDDVHPLITLLGVIVGIPLFGFIGLIFGPLMISLFLIIVRIYNREYGIEKKDDS